MCSHAIFGSYVKSGFTHSAAKFLEIFEGEDAFVAQANGGLGEGFLCGRLGRMVLEGRGDSGFGASVGWRGNRQS